MVSSPDIDKRKAKIVCTIGPASSEKRIISLMIKRGMNVARLNFSHGDHETHRRRIELIREIAKELQNTGGDIAGPPGSQDKGWNC